MCDNYFQQTVYYVLYNFILNSLFYTNIQETIYVSHYILWGVFLLGTYHNHTSPSEPGHLYIYLVVDKCHYNCVYYIIENTHFVKDMDKSKHIILI